MTSVTYKPNERRLTVVALAVVLMLSALDQTVVGTAMPRIIEQLHGLELIAWVSTAYMLTSTILVPIYGKISDLYGRKPVLIFGVTLFVFASMLCGLSGEFGTLPILGGGMTQLIVFRGLQGAGGAALFMSTFAIIADLFPPRERGKIMGLLGAAFSVAMVLGPLIGGFITDNGTATFFGREIAGWRWAFFVNFPLGIVALFMIITKMPAILSQKVPGRIDFLGAALLIVAFVPLLVALTWGGNQYAWASREVIGLFAVAAVALAAFLLIESRIDYAILPLSLFRNPVFSIANASSFLLGMALLGLVMFLPLFLQVVLGANATNSGWSMLPLMIGMMTSSISSGLLASKTGRYKPLILIGCAILAVGTVLLSRINQATTIWGLNWRMLIVGIGLGPSQSLFNLAIQNAVKPTQIGIATSSSQFFRQIGSTIGVAIFGALLVNNLTLELPRHVPLMGQSMKKIDLGAAQAQAMRPHSVRDQVNLLFDQRYKLIGRAYLGDKDAAESALADPATLEQVKSELRVGAGPVSPRELDDTLAQLKQAMDSQAAELTQQIEQGTKTAFSIAITDMFGASLLIVLLGFATAIFLPELPLNS